MQTKTHSHIKTIIVFILLVGFGIIIMLAQQGYFDGYSRTASGLKFKVLSEGEGSNIQEGEYMQVQLLCKTKYNEEIANTATQKSPFILPYRAHTNAKSSFMQEAISMLKKKGDCITFQVTAKEYFDKDFEQASTKYKLRADAFLFVQMSLEKILTKEEVTQWIEAKVQLKKDIETIDSYLKANNTSAQATASGLRYVIDEPSKGSKPQHNHKVKINYTGRLLDGTVFDTSLEEVAKAHGIYKAQKTYAPFEFNVGVDQVIQGLDEGIMLLKKGEQARLFIPSSLAYGSQAAGDVIQPNSVLMFEVTLVDILPNRTSYAKE